jgi:hypothetical protein
LPGGLFVCAQNFDVGLVNGLAQGNVKDFFPLPSLLRVFRREPPTQLEQNSSEGRSKVGYFWCIISCDGAVGLKDGIGHFAWRCFGVVLSSVPAVTCCCFGQSWRMPQSRQATPANESSVLCIRKPRRFCDADL